MASLYKVSCVWEGLTGLPGVSTFYMSAIPSISIFKAFFDSMTTSFPPGIKVTTKATGNIIEDSTGALTGQWSGGTDQVSQMSATGSAYSPATGAYVRWSTSTVLDGRLVRGRTFLVPIASGAYGADGKLTSSSIAGIQTGATQLVTSAAGKLVVWHRPKFDASGAMTRPGGQAAVTGATVPTKVGVLRSRRD